MQSYEKLGVFYLGRYHDLGARQTLPDLLLYNSNDLLTHALCVGMTGSGKTGLCFDIIEEAAIDGIPAILIDPKGDLANLLLTFPELRPQDFEPWVNPDEARKKGVPPGELRPSKTNISVKLFALAWTPHVRDASGQQVPAI
ncbi:MAG: ATP-binding protein [Verrucomicrobia bacterium]|nr:ATP-binding protein [Verrucomicrobiota bacterium]